MAQKQDSQLKRKLAKDASDNQAKIIYNCLMLGISLVGVLLLACGWYFNAKYAKSNQRMQSQVSSLQKKINDKSRANTRVIYYPKAGDANLSPEQLQSVQWLTNFFTSSTDYTGSTDYISAYKDAKAHISDKSFYDTFMNEPYTDGVNNIEVQGVKMKNIATQVIPTGNNEYDVYVLAFPYMNSSDLYQMQRNNSLFFAFHVKGNYPNFTSVKPFDDFSTHITKQTSQLGNLK